MTALYSLVTASGTSIALDASNGVVVQQTYGLDMPPVSNQGTDYALLDGASWQRARAGVRVATLQISAIGTSVDGTNGLHKIRAKLVNAVNPHRHGSSAMRLNYTGNTDGIRYLNCRYEAGLEGGEWRGFTETMTLRLLATDPYWYANTMAGTTLPGYSTMTIRNIASWADGVWSSMGGGTDDEVSAIAPRRGGGVYVGGVFSTAGNTAAHGIALWDGAKWSGLGSGVTRGGDPYEVRAIAVAPNGDVYAGGYFSHAGSTASRNVACWDVSANAWVGLNGGVKSQGVFALAVNRSGSLYVGGAFNTAGNTAAPGIARWNGSRWLSVGGGVSSPYVRALAIGPNNTVYVGGTFVSAGGVTARRIAMWNGSAWSTLGTGIGTSVTSYVTCLDYDYSSDLLYVGGAFNTAGGIACKNIACWNGRQWSPVGAGVENAVYGLRVLRNGWLVVTGILNSQAGQPFFDEIALWNGYSWVPFWTVNYGIRINVAAEDEGNDILYIGGWTDGARAVSSRTVVVNTGSAQAYPIITFEATSGSPYVLGIRNDTTDQTLWFNYVLQTGEVLTIDCTPGAKTVTSSFYGALVDDNPLPASQLATFCLVPGDNYISVLTYGNTASVRMTYTPAYWSRD